MGSIVQLGTKDYDEIFKLSHFAFRDVPNEKVLQRKKKEMSVDGYRIFGYKQENELAGKLHIDPMNVYINGKLLPMGGISDVATWPEFRRQGVAKALVMHALQNMKRQGEVLSFLHPFNVGFYRKFGWELTFTNKHYTIPIYLLARDWKTEGYMKRTDDYLELSDVYEQHAEKYNGMLQRDNNWWKEHVLTDEEAMMAVAYGSSGGKEAYIIYKVKDEIVQVLDFGYITVNGLHLLYKFIGNHDSMAREVEMTVPENDLLPHQLAYPDFEQTLKPYYMVRIVDVFKLLKMYPFQVAYGTVILEVEDDYMPENSGSYQLKTEDNGIDVSKMKPGTRGDIHCSVQALATILLSFKKASELHEHGLISGEESAVKRLDCMIPGRQTFFADFF